MKNHIEKIFIVLGAVALAVLNAVIPNMFLTKTAQFSEDEAKVSAIGSYKQKFPKLANIPEKSALENLASSLTSPLFTATTFFYTKIENFYKGKDKDFDQKVSESVPEYEIFINYSTPVVIEITVPQNTQPPIKKEVICEKPNLSISDNSPGKIKISITAGKVENATISKFQLFRNDKPDNPHIDDISLSNLYIVDEKDLEADKTYTYKVKQICKPNHDATDKADKEIFSDEVSGTVKQRFYINCLNIGTSTSVAKIHIIENKEGESPKEAIGSIVKGLLKVKDIVTEYTLKDIVGKPGVKNNNKVMMWTIKYCKEDAEGNCENNTLFEKPCVWKLPELQKSSGGAEDKKD